MRAPHERKPAPAVTGHRLSNVRLPGSNVTTNSHRLPASLGAVTGLREEVSSLYFDPYLGCSAKDRREWKLFALFTMRHLGWPVAETLNVVEHLAWAGLLHPGWWFGDTGDRWRHRHRVPTPPAWVERAWERFRVAWADTPEGDIANLLDMHERRERCA